MIEATTHQEIMESSRKLSFEIAQGRIFAHQKHGENSIENIPVTDIAKWLPILGEEFGEVCEALTYDKDSSKLRSELMDLIVVAAAWVDRIDKA